LRRTRVSRPLFIQGYPAASTPIRSQIATVIVTAARADCWISARHGSENGPVLEARLLAQGESVTLRGARVWMSIGASGNVDVTVNGEERELQSGTVAVVLGPTQVRSERPLNGDGDR
jgi:hypothetical protein